MKKTKNGYYKDGFVVDDDDDNDDDDDSDDSCDYIESKNKKQNLYNDEELEEEDYV
jgi:hypothetical protein